MVKVLPLLEMLPAAHKRHRRMLHVWRFVGHTCSMRSHEAWLWKRERMRHEAWLWRRELAELLEGRQLPQRHLRYCSRSCWKGGSCRSAICCTALRRYLRRRCRSNLCTCFLAPFLRARVLHRPVILRVLTRRRCV